MWVQAGAADSGDHGCVGRRGGGGGGGGVSEGGYGVQRTGLLLVQKLNTSTHAEGGLW